MWEGVPDHPSDDLSQQNPQSHASALPGTGSTQPNALEETLQAW